MPAMIAHAVRKIRYLTGLFMSIENWYVAFPDYFGLLTGAETTYTLRNGGRLKVAANVRAWATICAIYWLKAFNPVGYEIREGDVVVDIGAEFGIFSVFAATNARNVKVYSYEPHPQNFESLTENVRINGLQANIYSFKLAVAGQHGIGKLYIDARDPSSHSLTRQLEDWVPVDFVTLQEVFESNKIERCDLLKLNCEGAEYQILRNTPREYLQRIRKMAVQCHPIEFTPDADPEGLKRFLEDMGFEATLAGAPSLYCYARNTSTS